MQYDSGFAAEEERINSTWMLTLSDLLTLLLAFFILQFSMIKQTSAIKVPDLIEIQPAIQENAKQVDDSLLDQISMALAVPLVSQEDSANGASIELRSQGKDVVLSLPSAAFFGKSTELSLAATEHVRALARTINGRAFNARIVVETDTSAPKREFVSNWELTQAQAIVILRQMIDAGLSPFQISAVAYSDSRSVPEDLNSGVGHLNRRVEIVISPVEVH